MQDSDQTNGGFTRIHELEGEEAAQRTAVFSQLKPYCLELLDLVKKPKKDSSAISSLLELLRVAPSSSLQPFFDYALFPLLLLLDAAVNSRSQKKDGRDNNSLMYDVPKTPYKVSDKVVEGVIQCLEELLKKCHLGSVDQMVVVLEKLTRGALLTPSEAAEEFREGVIKCFRTLLLGLVPCFNRSCPCQQSISLPVLSGTRDSKLPLARPAKKYSEPGECLAAFLQSQSASAAVGHWLSLLLKAADTEAARGQLGSANIRIEAFFTLRVLVAKVGTADALAFFLPGVVSQFSKVLRMSKTMTSGAAGSIEAIDQAIRGLAEFLMIVLDDDVNESCLDTLDVKMSGDTESIHSFLEELQCLSIKAHGQSIYLSEKTGSETSNNVTQKLQCKNMSSSFSKGVGSLHVDRSKQWIDTTASHVIKLLCNTFPQICIHPVKKVRGGLLAAVQGLLTKCSNTLKESKSMLLECLCVLAIDDFDDVSMPAQEFLEYLLAGGRKYHIERDFAEIFSRLIEKLPQVVFSSEESLALTHLQKLLVVIYYSGPRFVVDHLQSPITAARFLDVFALCLSQNSTFTGSIDKLILARPSIKGYLHSVTELKASSQVAGICEAITNIAPSSSSKFADTHLNKMQYSQENSGSNYELPRMPPWFTYVGSQKLYQFIAGILRLVGLSLMADLKSEKYLSVVIDIPLGYIRNLISEIRMREHRNESWQSWCHQTGSGQLVRKASTAACILNEMIFGLSDQTVCAFTKMFCKSKIKREDVGPFCTSGQPCEGSDIWKLSCEKVARSHLIDCIGKILHEYQSCEIWNLPIDHRASTAEDESEIELNSHLIHDIAMLHQVIIEGIGIFSLCLGTDFASSGFLHSSLYLLLENLICSNFQVRSASDAVLHVLAATSGHPTVGHLVLANADYVIDSICRQLRHLDLNPHVPNVLAAMLSYIGVAQKILPLLEEPMRSVSYELEILGRYQHPDLTLPFLKAVAEIVKTAKHEASSLPARAESFCKHIKSKVSNMMKTGHDTDGSDLKPEKWESILFELNDFRRYRRTVGSIVSSCLKAATPLLALFHQAACLVALTIIEDGILAVAKVEEAYKYETQTREAIEEMFELYSLYELKDTLGATEDGVDENRLLPAANKIWPFLVVCVRNRNPVAVRRCFRAIATVIQICGGDFFARRFYTDGLHFWKILTTSPFQRKPYRKEEKSPLLLPYRNTSASSEDSLAEGSNMKVQIAMLEMISDIAKDKRSASALEVVLKKVSGLVVGIACSGVTGLRDSSLNALHGLAMIDPDLIWILLADVYYSLKKKDFPLPPSSDFPEISKLLPPPVSPKGFLYLDYGGQGYGFDVDFISVDIVFKKMGLLCFRDQMYS